MEIILSCANIVTFCGILTDLPKLITRVCHTLKNYLGFPKLCGILSFDYYKGCGKNQRSNHFIMK